MVVGEMDEQVVFCDFDAFEILVVEIALDK